MRRSVQVGIALLVLSARLWSKLFFVSDVLGKSNLAQYCTKEFISQAAVLFFVAYYILVKVLQQMIFRARMK